MEKPVSIGTRSGRSRVQGFVSYPFALVVAARMPVIPQKASGRTFFLSSRRCLVPKQEIGLSRAESSVERGY